MIHTYTSYSCDLELSKQTEKLTFPLIVSLAIVFHVSFISLLLAICFTSTGKRKKAGKVRVRSEEFEKCKAEGKCFKCTKEGWNVKYKDCGEHNKNLKGVVQMKSAKLVSTTPSLDFLDASSTTLGMSKKLTMDRYYFTRKIWKMS